jgi:putative glutamine amidotransferase
MQQIIRIGLTYTGTEEKHYNYVNWLKGDDQIEITRLSAADNNLDKVAEMDALVLSGGVDTHPKNYGSTVTHYPNAPAKYQEDRDEFEIAVFKKSQELQLPVLAICRGMQLINCVLGGDLVQDIGPEANELHRSDTTDEQHEVIILPGTLLADIAQVEKDEANSAHHQCVNTLGKGLLANALSADGITEGYEWEDKSGKAFLLGVQWHPERMYKLGLAASPLSKNIREYFMGAVNKSILQRK